MNFSVFLGWRDNRPTSQTYRRSMLCLWSYEASAQDVAKAYEYAGREGYTVFFIDREMPYEAQKTLIHRSIR